MPPVLTVAPGDPGALGFRHDPAHSSFADRPLRPGRMCGAGWPPGAHASVRHAGPGRGSAARGTAGRSRHDRRRCSGDPGSARSGFGRGRRCRASAASAARRRRRPGGRLRWGRHGRCCRRPVRCRGSSGRGRCASGDDGGFARAAVRTGGLAPHAPRDGGDARPDRASRHGPEHRRGAAPLRRRAGIGQSDQHRGDASAGPAAASLPELVVYGG